MLKNILTILLVFVFAVASASGDLKMKKGTPEVSSISQLAFDQNGILFLGDAVGGKVFAIDLDDQEKNDFSEGLGIDDLEGEVAAMLGTSKENVLIHDLAVNPISRNVYISASRGRAQWSSKWQLPNDLASADVLIRISPEKEFAIVELENVEYSSVSIPNPVDETKEHRWKKGVKQRVDAISDLSVHEGTVYISGLSNEEFAAAMWVAPFPFNESVEASTLEIYHGAHGKYETHAPIRTFLPYQLNSKSHIMAAYLCTPLVTFETDQLGSQDHVKGRTVAEFGSGNYPLDMITYENQGKEYVLMSNSQLPLLIFDPKDVESFEGEINTEVEGYMAGVKYTPRSGSGIQQLADFNEQFIVATQRMPSGKLSLVSLAKRRLIP